MLVEDFKAGLKVGRPFNLQITNQVSTGSPVMKRTTAGSRIHHLNMKPRTSQFTWMTTNRPSGLCPTEDKLIREKPCRAFLKNLQEPQDNDQLTTSTFLSIQAAAWTARGPTQYQGGLVNNVNPQSTSSDIWAFRNTLKTEATVPPAGRFISLPARG